MLMIHGGDNDGVNVLAVENGAVVASGRDARIVDGFPGGGVAAVIKIANRNALHAGNTEGRFEMFASANAGADGGEADRVAGSHRARRGRKKARFEDDFRRAGGGESSRTDMNELTTSQGILGHEIFRL